MDDIISSPPNISALSKKGPDIGDFHQTQWATDYDTGEFDTMTKVEKQKASEGEAKFNRLGWKRLTVILIVEAIGLGTFSLPSAFATLGLVAGVICCIGLGLVVIYTGYIVGRVKVVYPHINHYGDIGGLLMGRFGQELIGALYVLQLTLMTASYVLTGTIAFDTLSDNGACGLVFGIVSAVLLFLLAIMPSFTEAAILGYIDVASVIISIGIVIIGSGVQATRSPGGLASINWSAWPPAGTTFEDGMVAICNIMFAYSFCMFITPFMSEMHTPKDFAKSIWCLGIVEMVVYTVTGALIFVFVGADVQSPSLLSLEGVLSKVAFGFALPLIFISGAIGNTVTARYVHLRLYQDSIIRFINTPKGWITWIMVLMVLTIIAWVLGEAIPFFNDLLALSSALLISGFVLYFPSMMWFFLLREGKWYSRQNILHALGCTVVFLIGLVVLVGGAYASIQDILDNYAIGAVGTPFSC